MRILITCPPMLRMIDEFRPVFEDREMELVLPQVVQTLSEEELIALLPGVDGWVIGDDPATEKVFSAGKQGKLKAAVKWGVGVDNVDFEACRRLDIPIANTPMMFGEEVATLAVHYVIGLAREAFFIDRSVRNGLWPKPPGISLSGKTVAVIGFGDIGRNTVRLLAPFGVKLIVYDPFFNEENNATPSVTFAEFPKRVNEADFVVVTCALTPSSRHLINEASLLQMKRGVRVVNVSRGPIIDEAALVNALSAGQVHSTALDVFEAEPLPADSPLRQFEKCIFGTHNASNTVDAVRRASREAIRKLFDFLNVTYTLAELPV